MYKCPRCQQKAFDEGMCMACGFDGKKDIIDIIGDYEIIIDDPKKHIPWAIFAFTADKYKFLDELKKTKPLIEWKTMLLKDWYEQFEGGDV